jgi:acyl-CoA synthetase (AMP-forming)/AMP-acid ligase II
MTSCIDFLLTSFRSRSGADAIVWRDQAYNYRWLAERIVHWSDFLSHNDVAAGSVVALEADFSPNAVALFLALAEARCVLVPLTSAVAAKRSEFLEVAQAEISIAINAQDDVAVTRFNQVATHDIYQKLRQQDRPGLVIFSSGSTGKSKAAVHDVVPLLEKFKTPRHALRTISFLLYDHIGGINTMLYTLANGGCLVTVQDRSPDAILRAIDKHKVELLPTSPTFLNLVLISEAWKRYDISSLKTVSYGTEPMPESTLRRFHELFPQINLLQTYGLSEVGILRSKSRSSDSLWVKLGGDGFETRIADGILQIKAQSAMLGYLNAQSPFTTDGWYNTGDRVEVDGEWMRILGRESEIINVGGEKVYPAEVESVIQELPAVADAVVFGVKNPITGMMVCARVQLREPMDQKVFVAELKAYCRQRLQPYKVPVKVEFIAESQHSERFKKMRRGA